MSDLTPLLIIGGSGHARVVLDAARCSNLFRIVGLVDNQLPAGSSVDGAPVLGPDKRIEALIEEIPKLSCIVAIGDNMDRRWVVSAITEKSPRIKFAILAHPSAIIASSAVVEQGSFIAAGAIVNAGAHVGAHSVVNTGAIIDHDVLLEDFAFIGPNAALAGNIKICLAAMIGTGASVIPGVTIGAQAVVGAGAAVTTNVAPGLTVVGVPARPLVIGAPGPNGNET